MSNGPGHAPDPSIEQHIQARTKAVSGCLGDYVQVVVAQQDPGDGHGQSHVYELTERDDYVTIHRVGEAELAKHYND